MQKASRLVNPSSSKMDLTMYALGMRAFAEELDIELGKE